MPTLLHKLPECLAYRCAPSYLPGAHLYLVYWRNRQFYLGSLLSIWSYFSLFYILILSLRCLFSNKRHRGDVSWWEGGEEELGVEGGKLWSGYVVWKKILFSIKKKKKEKSIFGWVQLYSLYPGGRGQPELCIKVPGLLWLHHEREKNRNSKNWWAMWTLKQNMFRFYWTT